MKVFFPPALQLLIAVIAMGNAPASDNPTPADVTKALYRTAVAHFGFDAKSVSSEKEWLTADLYARLLKKAHEPAPKEGPPDIEGDVFLDSQEVPTHFEVGAFTVTPPHARVDVTLKWSEDKRHYTVLLTSAEGTWKVYDVLYGKTDKLTDLLK